jgi:hypothetical protein
LIGAVLAGPTALAIGLYADEKQLLKRRGEWRIGQDQTAQLEELVEVSEDEYLSELTVRSEGLGRFRLTHRYAPDLGGDQYSIEDPSTGWSSTLASRIHLPNGVSLPVPGDFDGMMAILDREDVTIEWELVLPEGRAWLFDERLGNAYPKNTEELRASLASYLESTGMQAEVPAGILQVCRLVVSSCRKVSEMGCIFGTLSEALVAVEGASRAGESVGGHRGPPSDVMRRW